MSRLRITGECLATGGGFRNNADGTLTYQDQRYVIGAYDKDTDSYELRPYTPFSAQTLVCIMMDLDALRLMMQDLADSQRTIVCRPEWAVSVQAMIDASPLPGLWTVLASALIPEGQVCIIDHWALEASHRQAVQRWSARPR
jgi:hypothetical protein